MLGSDVRMLHGRRTRCIVTMTCQNRRGLRLIADAKIKIKIKLPKDDQE